MDDDIHIPCLNLNKRKREASVERPSDSQVSLLESASPAVSPAQEHGPWFTAPNTEIWSSSTGTKRRKVQDEPPVTVRVPKPPTSYKRQTNSNHSFVVHGHSLQLENPHAIIDLHSPHIPSPVPLVNRQSLRELDFEFILRNTQLRHDVLFDSGLQFRQSSDRSHNKSLRETYWAAVTREVESGCTCVTFDLQGEPRPLECACPNVPSNPPFTPTFIVRNDPGQPTITLRMPSRIQPLLTELLEVLISVLKPIPMTTSKPPLSESRSYKHHKHEFHQQATYLRSNFSPQLIEQEFQRSTFESAGLFRNIGSMLKKHCAPMRDAQLEEMVSAAGRCTSNIDTVNIIRMCLDLLETMKLDIANHQLQHLRPALAGVSGRFELKAFTSRVARGKFPPPNITEEWMRTAHKSLASSTQSLPFPSQSLPYSSLTRNQQIYTSVLKGFIDIIFHPPSPLASTPNIIIQPVSPSSNTRALPGYPETTYLDNIRLTQLGNDATSLTTMYMWLLLYRQLRFSLCSKSGISTDEESRKLKHELRAISASRMGRCLSAKDSESDDLRQNVVVQIAMRLGETSSLEPGIKLQAAASSTNQLAQNWSDVHMRPNSPLSVVLRARLRDAVFHTVLGLIFGRNTARLGHIHNLGVRTPSDSDGSNSLVPDGLMPMLEDIHGISVRISQLADVHLQAYLPMYEAANGFLQP